MRADSARLPLPRREGGAPVTQEAARATPFAAQASLLPRRKRRVRTRSGQRPSHEFASIGSHPRLALPDAGECLDGLVEFTRAKNHLSESQGGLKEEASRVKWVVGS